MQSTLFVALLLLSASSSILAQVPQSTPPPIPTQSTPVQNDQDDVVRITTSLVQVDVVVTKNGKIVPGLQPTDFEIFEDGKKQTITNFLYVSNNPTNSAPTTNATIKENNKTVALPPVPIKLNESRRIMALVIDDLGLSAESMVQVRKQLRKFVDEQMQPNDLIAIIRTGADIGALQQFTNDKRLLYSAIKQARWNICSRVGPHVFASVQESQIPTMSEGGSACGISSVRSSFRSLRFILQAMGDLPGRKSMVLFSDSVPSQEQEVKFPEENGEPQRQTIDDRSYYGLLQRLAEIAIRNSVVIYGIDTQGLQYTGLTAADAPLANIGVRSGTSAAATNAQLDAIRRQRTNTLLRRREGADILSKETGGFLIKNSNDFQLDRIVDDQQGYYLLGYRPTAETFNRRFHKITAKVKGSGLSLRTRKGFYGFAEEEVAQMRRASTDPTMLALSSPFRAHDLAIDLTTIFASDADSKPLLRSYLYMDGKDVTFTDDGEGWHKGTVQIEGVIFGNNGRPLDRIVVTPTVRLTQSGYEQALREGIVLRFDMPLKQPGDYQLRVAAKDTVSSRIGSAGQFVTVPNLNNHQLALSGIVLSGEHAKTITITAPQASQNTTATRSGRPEITNNPVNRIFAAGSKLLFACYIYNASLDSNNQPKLAVEVKLYHEGKLIISTDQMPLDIRNQDPSRPIANGFVQLQPDLEPGRYFLQLAVSDLLKKGKEAPAVQLIDFEVVKN